MLKFNIYTESLIFTHLLTFLTQETRCVKMRKLGLKYKIFLIYKDTYYKNMYRFILSYNIINSYYQILLTN